MKPSNPSQPNQVKLPTDFDWVFFDCFNTLIDDFDETGDESGLGTLPDIAVKHGLFVHREEFLATYFEARAEANQGARETLLADRIHRTLEKSPANPSREQIDQTVTTMLTQWDDEYRQTLRPTPGVEKMLNYWSPRKKLGVISNFFLPHLPAEYLRDFGLDHHFDFILDSAAFGFKKPHRPIYEEAFRLAGIPATELHRVLMIGDRLDLDILAPQELGLQVLHLNRGQTRPDVDKTPEEIPHIHHWAEFRNPS